jgi:hypothetical protein
MRKKRFTLVSVANQVYVNSLMQYTYHAMVTKHGQRTPIRVEYSPGFFIDEFNAPQYLVRDILLEIVRKADAGQFTFYEYDRDGNKRTTELIYHDADYWQREIDWMKVEIGDRHE